MSKQDGLYFLPLGGCAEIGMNLNLYAYNDQWLMVDLGISFHDGLGVEVIMPNPQFIVEQKHKLKGLLLTHAHEDHIGAVPYLWDQLRCPLYATPFTAQILRYKLEEAGLLEEAVITEIPLNGSDQIGPFGVQMVRLTHSIPEPNGVLITTPLGKIFHTGDWKLDPKPLVGEATDHEELKKIGDAGVLAMICDSTNSFQEEVSGSEGDVFENLLDVLKKYPTQRIVVSCFASNVARLQSIAKAAAACKRKVAIAGRSFHRMEQASRDNGYLMDLEKFISPAAAANLKDEGVLYICTGSQGEANAALKRIAEDSYRDVRLSAGDVVIFSSREIPGNEKRIGHLKNLLIRKGIHVVTQHEYDIHVSGHPGRQELRQMYEWVRPKIAIPVHGELRHLVEHGKLARKCGVPEVLIADNGSLIRLAPGEAEIVEAVPCGKLGLDGSALIRLDHPVMKERLRLSCDGIVMVSVGFDADLKLLDLPSLTMKGLVNVDNVLMQAGKVVEEALENMSKGDKNNEKTVEDKIAQAVRRLFSTTLDKNPMVIVHLLYG